MSLGTSRPVAAATRTGLTIAVRVEKNGPEVAREIVTERDLADVRSETWLHQCLRQGKPNVPLSGFPMEISPVNANGDGERCLGYHVHCPQTSDCASRRSFYSIYSLENVAGRAAGRLMADGTLKAYQYYHYEVLSVDAPVSEAPEESEPGFAITIEDPPLAYLTLPIGPLVKEATAVGPKLTDKWMPVFYVKKALAQAEQFSRRGARARMPVETGCVLLGYLVSCPVTGEFYAVVSEALALTDADSTAASLSYSSKTWTRLKAVVKAKHARDGTGCLRIIGQAHGHNFAPHFGKKSCEKCKDRPTCSLTSVFVSKDDLRWSRAVFSEQPWQLCHVFGLTARNEKIHGLFGQKDGRLTERGFYRIDRFDPAGVTARPTS